MPRIVPIGIALLTVFSAGSAFGANTLIGWLAAPPEAPPEIGAVSGAPLASAAPASGHRATPVRAMSEEQYLDGIMSRNLFDVAAIDDWATRRKTATTEPGSVTTLKVKLRAVAVASPAEYSSALIADEDSPNLPSSYSIGDKLYDRTVVEIDRLRVGLQKPDGTMEYLTLDGGEIQTDRGTASVSDEPVDEGGVQSAGDNKFAVSRELFDKYINDLEGISRMGRALLHRGPDGEFDGYRLSAIRRNTLADQLGIKNGDIIHSVNGQPLNSVQAAMNAYNTMRTESSFCFEISRRGSPTELCYDVH